MIVQQDLDQQEAQAAKPGPLRGLRPQRWSVFRITTLVLACSAV
jgi:hypothetical protein